jgi:hypothetical protein
MAREQVGEIINLTLPGGTVVQAIKNSALHYAYARMGATPAPAGVQPDPYPGAVTDAEIPALIAQIAASPEQRAAAVAAVYGEQVKNRKYAVVAGVLRNSGPTAYFQPITDDVHRPIGINTVTTTATDIVVDFAPLGATRVVSFVATGDEAFTREGFTFGASVTTTQASIQVSRPGAISDYVSYSGTAWASANNVFTPSFNTTTGILTLTHPKLVNDNTRVYDVSLTGRGGVYVPQVTGSGSATTDTQVLVEFYDWAGVKQTAANTNMKLYVTRGAGGQLNPRLLDTSNQPINSANIWLFGLFEVA